MVTLADTSPQGWAAYHREIAQLERAKGNLGLALANEAVAAKYDRKAGKAAPAGLTPTQSAIRARVAAIRAGVR
jgi:hypothetical protein